MDQPPRILRKPAVNLLETLPRSLDDQEVDDRYKTRVEHAVDQIKAPFEVVNTDGRSLHDEIVEQPIHSCSQCGTFRTHAERIDFGRIEPRHGDPAEAECDEIEADEDGSDDARDMGAVVVGDFGADCNAEECDGLRGCHGH